MSTAALAARGRIPGNGIGHSRACALPRTGEGDPGARQGALLPLPLLLPCPLDCDSASTVGASTVAASLDVEFACFVWPGGVVGLVDVVCFGCGTVVGLVCRSVVAFVVAAGFEFVCALVEFARFVVLDCWPREEA